MRPFLPTIGSVLVLTSGCCDPQQECGAGGTDPDPLEVTAIRVDGGDGQVGPAGQPLSDVILVRTYGSSSGNPRPGVTIVFTIESGGGHLGVAPGSVGASLTPGDQTLEINTDQTGNAASRWYLGSTPGENRVRAKMNGKPNFVEFTATGHGPAAQVAIDRGDGQAGEAGTELADRVAVKITDANGIQVPGLRVWFIPQNGGLPVDGEVAASSRSGVAMMPSRWQLGPTPGPQTLVATVLVGSSGGAPAALGGNPVTFTATALAPAAHAVDRNPSTFPEPQNGTAGQPIPVKPSVKVVDGSGHGLAGVSVQFVVTAGGGTLGGLVTTHESITDGAGVLTVPDWILGLPGTNTVTATVQAANVSGNPVVFTANASALTLAITAGNNQSGPTNASLHVAPQVRVTGAGGVGVAGVRIAWTLVQGSGSFLPLQSDTDAAGYATLDYFGPTAVGPIQLQASTTDPRVNPHSVVFTLTGTPAP
jgi:hypothetical protein